MTKRQIIDEILFLNRSARPEFLARFKDGDLDEYLRHLRTTQTPRLSGNARRYEKYFENVPTIAGVTPGAGASLIQPDDEFRPQQEGDPALQVMDGAFPFDPRTTPDSDTELQEAEDVAQRNPAEKWFRQNSPPFAKSRKDKGRSLARSAQAQ